MEEIVKHINDTNASYRALEAGDAKNTDLFLDNEHYDLFKDAGEQITVRFNKENLQKAILFIASILPRKYDNSATHKTIKFSPAFVFDQLAFLDAVFTINGEKVETRTQVWNARKDVPKKNGEIDNRFYFNGLLEDVPYTSFSGENKTGKFTIRNYVAGSYSDIHIKKANDGIFDVWVTNTQTPYDDGKDKLHEIIEDQSLPLQQIFYGAPGTGKSHKIKDNVDVKVADEKNLVFRTTFHPDSDYSTFVGAYKPTTTKRAVRNVAGDIVKDTNKQEVYEDCITYSFIPQAFLQAYVAAWNNPDDKVFLVIEEINRGNCAQIFGDLFQLLDRDGDGVSEYPIMADKDIAKYLNGNDEEELPVLTNKDGIKDGKLRLPKNLYIWATMNTSDQSLFPIDSAFKRRWDWVYMPIADAKKNYVIEIDNDQYDWWSFLEAINAIIESTIHSEDKKLGYFFAKAKDGRITVETFVSKVIFYLWNDVFKDNETNHKAFKDNDGELLPFRKFFNHDGTVDTNMVIKFLQDLEVFPFEHSDDGTMVVSDTTPNTKRQRDKSRYRVNGTDNLNKAQMTREAFRLYIEAYPDADAQTIAQAWNGLGLKDYVQHLVETEAEFNARTKDSTDTNKRATEFELSNGEKIYLSTQFGIGNIGKFMDAVNNAGWNIRIENQD